MILATACLAYAASAALFGGAVGVTEALVKTLILQAFLAAAEGGSPRTSSRQTLTWR